MGSATRPQSLDSSGGPAPAQSAVQSCPIGGLHRVRWSVVACDWQTGRKEATALKETSMAYTANMAALLSGASQSQLRYWRQSHKGEAPLLVPEHGTRPHALYSYRDVLVLRMFARLRGEVSLQTIRRAVTWMEEHLADGQDLSERTLLAVPEKKSIVYFSEDGEFLDVGKAPRPAGRRVQRRHAGSAWPCSACCARSGPGAPRGSRPTAPPESRSCDAAHGPSSPACRWPPCPCCGRPAGRCR